jgi:hypothetical protein
MKMSGASMIDQERNRQIYEENWSAEHDDSHRLAEMTLAALSYASLAASQMRNPRYSLGVQLGLWPWSSDWWKPSKDPIRNLVKAGALIAAEIDRLQRIESENKS